MKHCRVLLFVFSTFLVLPVYAQINAAPQAGITPYTPFQNSDLDSVNLANGNVTVHIPVISFPQVGKSLKLDFLLRFNQPIWNANLYANAYTDPSDQTVASFTGYWNLGNQYSSTIGMPVGITLVRSQGITVDDSILTYPCYDQPEGVIGTCDGVGLPGDTDTQSTAILESIRTGDGADHSIGMLVNTGIVNGNNNVHAPDGSGWYALIPDDGTGVGVFQDTEGNTYTEKRISGAGYGIDITDANGNTITTNDDNTGWTDSVGRVIPGSYSGIGAIPEFDPTPGLIASNTSNCPSGTSAERYWSVPAINGTSSTTATYYMCYTKMTASTDFGTFTIDTPNVIHALTVGADNNTTQTEYLMTAFVLPDGNSYQFSYDNYFELTQISLPTGGTISYTWKTIPWDSCSLMNPVSRVISTKTVNPSVGAAETWTYNYFPVGNSCNNPGLPLNTTTLVTKPDGNDELHASGGGVDNTLYYSGCAPSPYNPNCGSAGPVMEAVVKVLAQDNSPFYIPGPIPSTNVQVPYVYTVMQQYNGPELSTTTTWVTGAGSLTSAVVNTLVAPKDTIYYNSGANLNYQPYNSTYYTTGTCNACENYGLIQAQTAYNFSTPGLFGTPSPTNFPTWPAENITGLGTAIKTTTTTYVWQQQVSGGENYLTANMLTLPAQTVTTDGSGNWVAETQYGYDAPSNAPSGTRGNLTSVTRDLSSQPLTPEPQTKEPNGLTTQNFYNSQGMITESTDPNENPTQLSYQCSGSLPSVLTNAAGQTTTYVYDCSTGLIQSVTDANNATTSYTHDTMQSLTSISYPDGGSTSYNYHGYSDNPLNITVTKTATPDPPIVADTFYDGLGRTVLTQMTSDPEGADSTNTTYDSMGRVASVTNAYRTSSDPTYGTTYYTYDALGRKTVQQQPDGSTLQWCYNGVSTSGVSICKQNSSTISNATWVDSQDESGNIMQHESDALGRLQAAIEPNPQSNTLQLETDYLYNALDDLTSVNQLGNSSGDIAHSRSFTYDALSRLSSSTNLETGTINYSYPTSSGSCSGDMSGLCSKTDARGVQTIYTYDNLNRLTGKTYSDGATLSSCYQYGTSTSGYTVGRLVAEWTQGGSCPSAPNSGFLTERKFTYDSMGRILTEQQCTPSSSGSGSCTASTPFALIYQYDLAGNLNQYNNGVGSYPITFGPGTNFITYDSAGRLTSMPSSLSGTQYPSQLFTVNSTNGYTPAGALQNFMFGNGVISVSKTYDDRLRVTGETATRP